MRSAQSGERRPSLSPRDPPRDPPTRRAGALTVGFSRAKDEAGALFKAISVFAVREINLSKIESRPHRPGALASLGLPELGSPRPTPAARPSKRARSDADGWAKTSRPGLVRGEAIRGGGASFEYAFYVDILASPSEERTRNALRHLEELSSVVRVLGCFPLDGVMLEAGSGRSAAVTSPSPPPRQAALTIAIVGFGTFGQFMARTWAAAGHVVVAQSRTDYSDVATGMGVRYVRTAAELVALKPDVLVLAVSILSFETVLSKLPKELLSDALVVDVLSVKAHAKGCMLRTLPPS